jgi:hypothetical protein
MPLVTAFERLDEWAASEKRLTGAAANHIGELESRVCEVRRALFDDLCETFMQIGQAEEWARESPEQDWALGWVAMLRLMRRETDSRSSPPPSPALDSKKQGHFHDSRPTFGFAREVRRWLREAKQRLRQRNGWWG